MPHATPRIDDDTAHALADAEAAMGGALGVRASRLDGSDPLAWRDDEQAPAASTVKLFLLVALLERVAAGEASLADEVVLGRDDQVTGSGVLKSLQAGRSYSLRDLATLMIIVSDNSATNLVLDAVGLERFRSSLREHGWTGTTASGKLQTVPRNPPSLTTPRDLHDAIVRLWRGELLPGAETAFARDVLGAQQYTDDLGRQLDYDSYATEMGESALRIASKGGAVRGVRNEVAVIRRGDDGFALAITTRDCPDPRFHVDNAGALCVARVTRLLYDRYLGDGAGH
jgi:beta-lactamase class A